jgi:hypothetical protein
MEAQNLYVNALVELLVEVLLEDIGCVATLGLLTDLSFIVYP